MFAKQSFLYRYAFLLICLFFFGYVLIEKLLIFYNFHVGFIDLYFYDHACWNISRGLGPWLDYFHKSFLADHFYSYLFLIAPFYWIKTSPIWIFIAHALVLVLILIPILKISNEQFGFRGMIMAFVILFFTYTFRQQINQDLHGDIVMAALISWILYWLVHERYQWVLVLTLALPFAKETAGLTVIMIGVYLWIFRKRMWEGFIIIAYGIISMYGLIHYIIPYFNGTAYRHFNRFNQFGATFSDQLKTVFLHPMTVITYALGGNHLAYLAGMILPLVALPLFSAYSLIALGILAQNLLGAGVYTIDIGGHYSAGLVPIFAFATIQVMAKIKQTWTQPAYTRFIRIFKGVSIFFIGVNILVIIFMEARFFWISPHVKAGHEALKLIPATQSVSASEVFYIHLHYRSTIEYFPVINRANYVIAEQRETLVPDHINQTEYLKTMWHTGKQWQVLRFLILGQYGTENIRYQQTLTMLANDPNYQLIFEKEGVVVYQRKSL